MASWTTYKGLQVPDASSGDAGENLTDNLKQLADNFDILLTDDGSAAAPSHSFENDTNCGLYRITTDTIGVATGGNERLRIDSNGNIGIGVTSTSSTRINAAADFTSTSGAFLGIRTTATLTPTASATSSLIGNNTDAIFAGSHNSSTFCYGARNSARSNSSGSLTLLVGTYSDAYIGGSGSVSEVYGIYNQVYLLSSSGGISSGSVYVARSIMQDSSNGTIGRLIHFHSIAAGIGTGGASIVNFAGLCVESQTVAANNTYVLLGTNSVPSGNWTIYSTSTNPSQFAGVLLAPSGSASAPGYAFASDANTGIYSSSADTLDLAVGGTNIATFSSIKLQVNTAIGLGAIRALNSVIEFHVRPAQGTPGYVTWTEDAVADRWALGIKPSDSNLYLATGAPGSLTDRFIFSSAGNLTLKHLIGGTSTPSISAGAGAGTSPTVSVAGTDAAGEVAVTTGTSPAASSVVATITFNAPYGAAPYVVFSPSNGNAAMLSNNSSVYATTTTTTFVFNIGSTALTASTTYKWHYQVVQ